VKEQPMTFYTGPVPDELRTGPFYLRPLRAGDNDLDYAAMCDRWETKAWVAEGNVFSRQVNLTELRAHEAEHEAREAFTFTVMNPGETECLGCVYITPLLSLLREGKAAADVREGITDKDAALRFWLRDAYRKDVWDVSLLQSLLEWLAESWTFPRLVFHTNAEDARQRELFEAHQFRLLCLLELRYGAFYRLQILHV
jgi:hypothetical protein